MSRGSNTPMPYSVRAKDNAKPLCRPRRVVQPVPLPLDSDDDNEEPRRPAKSEERAISAAGDEPRISLSEGSPVAVIHGGEYDKQVVHVCDEPGDPYDGADPLLLLGEDFLRSKKRRDGKRLTVRDLDELSDALSNLDPEYLSDYLLPVYDDAIKQFLKQNRREFAINEGTLHPLPDCETERECIYVAGPSKSGKSTFIARWCNEFRKIVPDIKINLFSRLKEDKVLDLLQPNRVLLDEDLVKNPLEPESLANSICLFDDCDTIPDAKVQKYVNKLRDDILETGRHHNIWCLSTAHNLTNYQKTRVLLNEATKIVVFPRSGSIYHIRRVCKEFFGFDKKDIDRVLKLPSRWVCITRTAPQMVMHEKGCYLVGGTP